MIFAIRITFLMFTAFAMAVASTLVYHHGKVSTPVTLGVMAIVVACIGQITAWDGFRPAKSGRAREEILEFRPIGGKQ